MMWKLEHEQAEYTQWTIDLDPLEFVMYKEEDKYTVEISGERYSTEIEEFQAEGVSRAFVLGSAAVQKFLIDRLYKLVVE